MRNGFVIFTSRQRFLILLLASQSQRKKDSMKTSSTKWITKMNNRNEGNNRMNIKRSVKRKRWWESRMWWRTWGIRESLTPRVLQQSLDITSNSWRNPFQVRESLSETWVKWGLFHEESLPSMKCRSDHLSLLITILMKTKRQEATGMTALSPKRMPRERDCTELFSRRQQHRTINLLMKHKIRALDLKWVFLVQEKKQVQALQSNLVKKMTKQ